MLNKGGSKFNLNTYKEALLDFNRAIDLEPDFAEAYYNRGVLKNSMGDKKGAAADFLKAEKLGYATDE